LMNIFRRREAASSSASSAEQAVTCFRGGINCAQALLSTYGPRFGLDQEHALRVSGAFGSGMGLGDTCGAVTGALMVIGLKYARIKGGVYLSREKTYDVAAEFITRFRERNSTVVCRELLGCDISTREGFKEAKKEKYFKKRCPKYVQDAAEILEEILARDERS
jgi:C_GCAxxG_C_C family probable redox protein